MKTIKQTSKLTLQNSGTVITSSVHTSTLGLDPWYLTGFADGEAAFMVLVERRGEKWIVRVRFAICLSYKDKPLLEKIQSQFGGVGLFSKWDTLVQYRVNSFKDINNIIIPHFDEYPLLTQKRADYELFKSVVEMMNRGEHLTDEGIRKIVAIRASINLGLSDTLKEAFPNIVPVSRPKVEFSGIPDPQWLAGFTDAEGMFLVVIQKSKTKIGFAASLRFSITQHCRDIEVMRGLIDYLDCGKVVKSSNRNTVEFVVNKFPDVSNKIVPFFTKHSLVGSKNLNFMDFCRTLEIFKVKAHLTVDGLEQIRIIKAGMNSKR